MSTATPSVSIYKASGTKNEFVLVDERPRRISDYADFARRLCDRRGPVGADGLLVLLPAPVDAHAAVAAAMRIFNADGSEAEMCGNGVRCVARYLWERGTVGATFAIWIAGQAVAVAIDPGPALKVHVDLGRPEIHRRYADAATVEAGGGTWRYAQISAPNPHVVAFVPDVDAVDLGAVGPAIATHPAFAGGTNVHVAQIVRDRRGVATIRARHYERGVGMTQSCGTGAVAVAVAAIDDGRVTSPVTVCVPGGVLEVAWSPAGGAVLTGTAEVEDERAVSL